MLVDAAVARRELDPAIDAYALMRAVANLCIHGPGYERKDARAMGAKLHAVGILDDGLAHALASRHVQLARETGAVATLPAALSFLASVLTLSGELGRAGELAVESTAIAEATGSVVVDPDRHHPTKTWPWTRAVR